jgi:uncharacterized protein
MLVVDLNTLARAGRSRVDVEVPPGHAFWQDSGVTPHSPLQIHVEAQQAGPDVVVRGTLKGEFELECRRCLAPVVAGIEETIGLLYRAGTEPDADEPADVLPLPRGAELELTEAVREHVLLAVPRYVICRKDCQGICPECGANLNEAACGCEKEEVDDRWAPLRRLKADE